MPRLYDNVILYEPRRAPSAHASCLHPRRNSDRATLAHARAMSWPQHTKAELLPIEKTAHGYVQTSHWRQGDRHDEEVVEIDSPYAVSVASGTEVIQSCACAALAMPGPSVV